MSGNPKFFFGSDSAPHPSVAKRGGPTGKSDTAAGVFTQSYVTQYVLLALEEAVEKGVIEEEEVTKEVLEGFLSRNGREFYGVGYKKDAEGKRETVVLERKGERIVDAIKSQSVEVVCSRAGDEVLSLRWGREQ